MSWLSLQHITTLCKKEKLFWLKLVTSVSYLLCTIKHSGVPLPALHSNGHKLDFHNINTIDVMGECFANEKISNDAEKSMKLR